MPTLMEIELSGQLKRKRRDERILELEKQRDKLLDALVYVIDLYDGRKHEGIAIIASARAAISSVKGGA